MTDLAEVRTSPAVTNVGLRPEEEIRCILTLKVCQKGGINCIRFNRTSSMVAVGDDQGRVSVWMIEVEFK